MKMKKSRTEFSIKFNIVLIPGDFFSSGNLLCSSRFIYVFKSTPENNNYRLKIFLPTTRHLFQSFSDFPRLSPPPFGSYLLIYFLLLFPLLLYIYFSLFLVFFFFDVYSILFVLIFIIIFSFSKSWRPILSRKKNNLLLLLFCIISIKLFLPCSFVLYWMKVLALVFRRFCVHQKQ